MAVVVSILTFLVVVVLFALSGYFWRRIRTRNGSGSVWTRFTKQSGAAMSIWAYSLCGTSCSVAYP